MKTREELLDRYENEPTASKFSKSDKVLHFTVKELKEVLSAPTEEQMKCEYCHEPFIPLYSESDTSTGVIEQHKVFGVYANGRKLIGLKFPYCPFCGRKLGDE